jgi:ribosomal protein S27E
MDDKTLLKMYDAQVAAYEQYVIKSIRESGMLQCPKCERITLIFDSESREARCLWPSCGLVILQKKEEVKSVKESVGVEYLTFFYDDSEKSELMRVIIDEVKDLPGVEYEQCDMTGQSFAEGTKPPILLSSSVGWIDHFEGLVRYFRMMKAPYRREQARN